MVSGQTKGLFIRILPIINVLTVGQIKKQLERNVKDGNKNTYLNTALKKIYALNNGVGFFLRASGDLSLSLYPPGLRQRASLQKLRQYN